MEQRTQADGSAEPRQLPEHADVVVVGAGFAGLSVAGELARRGRTGTIVLEAGPDLGHVHYRLALDEETAVTWWLHPESDPSFRRPYSTDGPAYLGIAGLRERVGGRSLYWHGAVLPIEEWALSAGQWPQAVVADLVSGFEGGPSLYARVAAELSAWSGGSLGDGRTVSFGEEVFGPAPRAVRVAADGRWAAFSPLAWWHDDSLPVSPPLFPDTPVSEIVVRGGRAVGVRVVRNGRPYEIGARHVVLAGGAIENSRLAMQAMHDVGSLDEPRFTGLVDKLSYGFNVVLDPADLPPELREAAREGVFACRACDPGLRSNGFLLMYVNPHGMVVIDSWLLGEQIPGDTSVVTCDPAAGRPWRTVVTAGLGPQDERLCARQRAELERLWTSVAAAVGRRPEPLVWDEKYGSPDLAARLTAPRDATCPAAPRTYSFPLGAEQHEAATTPLGRMLDDHHQFHTVPGLFAAGPSVFPRTGAANPVLTILALAKRLAAKIPDGVIQP